MKLILWFVMLMAASLSSCASRAHEECALPPLPEQEIRRIGREFLDTQAIDPKFRERAEKRVTVVGCDYEYEEAEKLDSFGVGFVVVIDRRGKVLGFHSTE